MVSSLSQVWLGWCHAKYGDTGNMNHFIRKLATGATIGLTLWSAGSRLPSGVVFVLGFVPACMTLTGQGVQILKNFRQGHAGALSLMSVGLGLGRRSSMVLGVLTVFDSERDRPRQDDCSTKIVMVKCQHR